MRATPPVAKARAPGRIELVTSLTRECAARLLICGMDTLLGNGAVVAQIAVARGNRVHPPRRPFWVCSYADIPRLDFEVAEVVPRRTYGGRIRRKQENARTETLFGEVGAAGTEAVDVTSTMV